MTDAGAQTSGTVTFCSPSCLLVSPSAMPKAETGAIVAQGVHSPVS